MNALLIEGTSDTPTVVLDQQKGVFELSGRSLPEDAVGFYTPVMAWIKEYAKAPNATTPFRFKLDYFNTASSKLILDLLHLLKGISGLKIEWSCYEDDEDGLEAGKEFAEQVNLEIEFKLIP